MARAQAQTATSIVQLTSSVAALVQRAGILFALPPPPSPAAPARTYAAITGAPAPAADAASASGGAVAMGVAAAGGAVASGAAAPAGPSWHGQIAPAGADGSTHVGASPCAEIDMNDGSMPVLDEAPVSRRTRYSLAIVTLLSSAPGTTQGTVEWRRPMPSSVPRSNPSHTTTCPSAAYGTRHRRANAEPGSRRSPPTGAQIITQAVLLRTRRHANTNTNAPARARAHSRLVHRTIV